MKTGLDIQELAAELERQNESKIDFIAHTGNVSVVPVSYDDGPYGLSFKVDGKKGGRQVQKDFEMNRFMLGQIASHTKIPMQVVDLLQTGTKRERQTLGELLTVRLQDHPSVRMIRTMDDRKGNPVARAFLSEKYRRLDNYDLADAVLPVLAELEKINVQSSEITDERMYIKCTYPEMQFEIGKAQNRLGRMVGDIIEAGIVISNSEVGAGSLRVEPFIYRLICLNGMVSNDHRMRRNHVGRKNDLEDFDMARELFSSNTLSLDDAAFYSKVTDVVRATLTDENKFFKIASRIMAAKDEPITGEPQAAIYEMARRYTINESHTQGILSHLIKGGDLSKFGIANAVTAFARDDKNQMDYDTATNFEYVGGKIIELGPSEWRVIANAHDKKKGGDE